MTQHNTRPSQTTGPQPYLLFEANFLQLAEYEPNLAILPWGATEAHNHHLPHGTDVLEATRIAEHAAHLAHMRGAKPLVLPTIPFGNNAQQLDQVATIHFSTATADAILNDVCMSLTKQGIDRLVLLNAHGGNEFKPLVRDAQLNHEMLIVVVNFFQLAKDIHAATFENPGDHADEMETSLLLHLAPHLVVMEQAGYGERIPFDIPEIAGEGVWTPRPWSAVHPDTGAGDPTASTADKGRIYFEAVTKRIADLLCAISKAEKGQTPYL